MVLTVTDIYNNPTVCKFKVVVEDREPPQVICPASFNVTLPIGQTGTVVNWQSPVATDNVNIAVFTVSKASGGVLTAGEHTIMTFANDTSGNLAIPCQFTVFVRNPGAAGTTSSAAASSAQASSPLLVVTGTILVAVGVLLIVVAIMIILRNRRGKNNSRTAPVCPTPHPFFFVLLSPSHAF